MALAKSQGLRQNARTTRTRDRQANITVKAQGEPDRAVGSGASGGGRTKRNAIVRAVMQRHGLSLPAASKYVMDHNLYCIFYPNLIDSWMLQG